jgi:hypothetical protein
MAFHSHCMQLINYTHFEFYNISIRYVSSHELGAIKKRKKRLAVSLKGHATSESMSRHVNVVCKRQPGPEDIHYSRSHQISYTFVLAAVASCNVLTTAPSARPAVRPSSGQRATRARRHNGCDLFERRPMEQTARCRVGSTTRPVARPGRYAHASIDER